MNVQNMVRYIFVGLIMAVMSGCGSREDNHVVSSRDAYPQRIICATPGLTEVVFALGAGDRVVGISDYTVWPPEALTIPRIGGWMNPDRERLLLLQPDVILTQGLHEPLRKFADRHNIRLVQIPTDTLEDVLQQFVVIGALLGAEEKGRAIARELADQLDGIRDTVADLPPQRTVMLFERPEGVMRNLTTIGPRTFLSSLLEMAGGENVFQDVMGDYPQISRESLLMRAPEVIMEIHSEDLDATRRASILRDWQVMPSLPAVRDGRIVFLTGDYAMIPGPRILDTVEKMAGLLHPESF